MPQGTDTQIQQGNAAIPQYTFDLGVAIALLKLGKRVARQGWNAHHSLGLQHPTTTSKNTLPYVYMVIGDDAQAQKGARVPWICSQTDMLADDWIEVGQF
jgi:hypothetical protein